MRTALAVAPMRFPLQLDAASAREIRENSTGGGPVHYDVPSGKCGVSIEMNAKTTAEDSDPAIQFQNVTYSLNGNIRRGIVNDIRFSVASGQTLVLLGRSGSGKTTLLKLINRLLVPTAGQVIVRGRPTTDWDPIRLRRGIGYVIQDAGLFPHFTVAQNIALVPFLEKWDAAHTAARALAADPPILLMDEPFGALDPVTRAELQREFSALARRLGKTIVFVTHDLREALLLASRIALLEAGRIVAVGTPQEFLHIDHPEVHAFTASLATSLVTQPGVSP